MKNFKFFSICLMLALFSVTATNAQNAVMSGSFEFMTVNKRTGILVLQSGMQKFEFPISDNIVIANLLPGRYSLMVEFQSGGRGGGMTRLSQNIEIESERRTVCRMNASAVLGFAREFDRNSMPLLVGNFHDDRRGFDRRDGHHQVQPMPMPQVPPMPQPVSELDFNKLYNAVKNEKFSDTKMRTLRTSSNFHEFFSSDQVMRLAALFTNDTDKLECVKFLAPKVLDVQNLPFIQDVFKFKQTKDDYLRWLNRR